MQSITAGSRLDKGDIKPTVYSYLPRFNACREPFTVANYRRVYLATFCRASAKPSSSRANPSTSTDCIDEKRVLIERRPRCAGDVEERAMFQEAFAGAWLARDDVGFGSDYRPDQLPIKLMRGFSVVGRDDCRLTLAWTSSSPPVE